MSVSTSLNEDLKTLYASSGVDVILPTLTFSHGAWDSDYYIVRDFNDLVANLENSGPEVTFQKFAFNINGPSKNTSGSQYLTIQLDNANRQLMDLLDQAITDVNRLPIRVTYRIYISSDTSGPQNDPPLTLSLRKVMVDNLRISGTAEITNLVNTKFPSQLYGPGFKSLYASL